MRSQKHRLGGRRISDFRLRKFATPPRDIAKNIRPPPLENLWRILDPPRKLVKNFRPPLFDCLLIWLFYMFIAVHLAVLWGILDVYWSFWLVWLQLKTLWKILKIFFFNLNIFGDIVWSFWWLFRSNFSFFSRFSEDLKNFHFFQNFHFLCKFFSFEIIWGDFFL